MEVIQGKATDKKIIIAQEIAFAKVLAGNNKTLRDRAVKKLRKWLTVRGNGKWAFTEDEFLRIWTGLFYCMWMSDKFLVQEELAESISHLIHCFKKNSDSALLFIKCFNKRILMDWEGLDQYRIDKFNMLVRRFLRQTFVYFKEKNWDESLLRKLMGIFFNVVLHRDNSLGFVMHFISIYAEELAKVSKGKISTETVLVLIEPFVKLLARSKDMRIQKETEDFFIYLIRQTDTGIEFEEKFNAWREQGFPGQGPHSMVSDDITHNNEENGDGSDYENDEENDDENIDDQGQPLDPRAGSVHVYLPQIPIDADGVINLFKKHQNSRFATKKGRRIINNLIHKYSALRKGKFPAKIKKDPILDEDLRKKKLSLKNAKKLIEFTHEIKDGPIKTREFRNLSKELEEQDDSDFNNDEEELGDSDLELEDVINKEIAESQQLVKKGNNKPVKKKRKNKKVDESMNETKNMSKKQKLSNELKQEIKENQIQKENGVVQKNKKNKKLKNFVGKKTNLEGSSSINEVVIKPKKNHKVNGMTNGLHKDNKKKSKKVEKPNKAVEKRKILSNWQVQDLNSNSPEYYKIETQKIIRLEKKINDGCYDENEPEVEKEEEMPEENELENKKTASEEIVPVFWEKARQKVNKKSGKKNKIFVNPFAKLQTDSKSPGRRISFALDKNMAQENDEYLEEVKNSPRVPFDGTRKPVQSALKSGLAPSPINPFYSFKKMKF